MAFLTPGGNNAVFEKEDEDENFQCNDSWRDGYCSLQAERIC